MQEIELWKVMLTDVSRRRTVRYFPLNSLQPQLFRQLLPLAVDQGFGLGVHQDFIRPGTREAFARPLSRSVDAHLRAVIGQARSVVERIDRSERELYVALGIDVVEHFQRNVTDVLHVDVFIYRSEEHTSELQSRGHLVCR